MADMTQGNDVLKARERLRGTVTPVAGNSNDYHDAVEQLIAAVRAERDAVLAASVPPLELKPHDEAHLRAWAKKDPEQFHAVKSIASLLVEWDFARATVAALRRQIEFALPSLPTTGRELTLEEMSAIKLRWSTGPEKYQNDADALIGCVIALRARAEHAETLYQEIFGGMPADRQTTHDRMRDALVLANENTAHERERAEKAEASIATIEECRERAEDEAGDMRQRAEVAEAALTAEREKYEMMKKAFDAEDNATVLFADAKVEKARRERIVAVAVKHSTGVVLTLPAPARHHNVLHVMSALDIYKTDEARHEQGFITSTGRFVGREEAEQIAEAAEQILRKTPGRGLFSEDVW